MDGWALSTYFFVGLSTIAYVVFFIVISIGGAFDLIYLFKSLNAEIIDTADDGRARNVGGGQPVSHNVYENVSRASCPRVSRPSRPR